MLKTVEISFEEIKSLNEHHLTELLRKLLIAEARLEGIKESCVQGTLDIKVADGGTDASIEWEGIPSETNWFRSPTLFQIKATQMGPKDCANELLAKQKALKPAVKELIDRGGRYVLFCNKPGKDTERIKEMRKTLSENGVKNAEEADIQVYNPTGIADWTNKHFGAIVAVRSWTGRPYPAAFQTWDRLGGYKHLKADFVTTDNLNDHMQTIREQAKQTGSVVRIVGLSGLGKTRLLLEAFKGDDLRHELGYIDASFYTDQLAQELIAWSSGISGILVVDNCSKRLHDALAIEVEREDNHLSLITLDFNPGTVSGNQILIPIKPLPDPTIEKILQQAYSHLPKVDLQRIVEFAEGYPRMAVLLQEADLRAEGSLATLTDTQLVERLLWEPNKLDADGQRVIEACALFEYFHFDDQLTEQMKFIAGTVCGVDGQKFYEHVQRFAKRGVIQKIGSFAKVSPKPLACWLAAKWWEVCSIDFANSLAKQKWPDALVQRVCGQLTFLSGTKAARAIATALCEEDHPFASAENLKTEQGSRIFQALSEVNPEAVVDCIAREFNSLTTDELLKIGPGRRNLIWALENLCFWSDTFERAAMILLRFAAAENEKIGNNATNQFAQLFHARLPGTAANLTQRLQVIDGALAFPDEPFKSVTIKALSSALEFSHFHRTGGVEKQGGRMPEKDYDPPFKEILEYWEQIIYRLKPFAYDATPLGDEARSEISKFFLAMLRYHLLDLLELTVKDIINRYEDYWLKGKQQLSFALRHEGPRLTREEFIRVESLLALLSPKTLEDRFRLFVSAPSHTDYDFDESGNLINLAESDVDHLAKECGQAWPEWSDKLSLLLRGNHGKADAFGEKLAKQMTDPEGFLMACIATLREQPTEDVNPTLVAGFLVGIKDANAQLVTETMDAIAEDDKLNKFATWFMARVGLKSADITRTVKLLEEDKIAPDSLITFSYGGVLKNLPSADIIMLVSKITDRGLEAVSIAVLLLYMYSFQSDERWEGIRAVVRTLLLREGLMREIALIKGGIDFHNWAEFVKRLLKSGTDEELAKHISKEIAEVCGTRDDERLIYKIDHPLQEVLEVLLSKYYAASWPVLAPPLLSEDWRIANDAIVLLGNTLDNEKLGHIFSMPLDYLLNWCEENKPKAPQLVARYMPLLTWNELRSSLHPIAEAFIGRFGNLPEITSELSQNLWSFGWVGSLAQPYEARLKLLEGWKTNKHSTIRDWAIRESKGIEIQHAESKKRDEEHRAGIMDGWTL